MFLLVPAHQGSPGQSAVKRLYVYVCVWVLPCNLSTYLFLARRMPVIMPACWLTLQLKSLHQPASRLLIAALTLFAGAYPRTLMNSVMVPVIRSESCNALQAEVVLKLVKTVLNSDHYAELLRSAVFDLFY